METLVVPSRSNTVPESGPGLSWNGEIWG